jgi:hypothetical protein
MRGFSGEMKRVNKSYPISDWHYRTGASESDINLIKLLEPMYRNKRESLAMLRAEFPLVFRCLGLFRNTLLKRAQLTDLGEEIGLINVSSK